MTSPTTSESLQRSEYGLLKEYLSKLGPVAVAFSGGVDSTFLLKTARDVLGERVIAITATSPFLPEREMREAREFCEKEGIRQIIVPVDVLSDDEITVNPKDRCYLCKKVIFGKFLETAEEAGFPVVAEGSNKDDEGDYRPGLKAIAELGIKSPLRDLGLTKERIRALSKELGLPTFDKPSYACLASRIPYGDKITKEKLSMIDKAEQILISRGYKQVRVRAHGNLARIELEPGQIAGFASDEIRTEIYEELKNLGFTYVTLDIGGYRTGSLNEVL